MEHLSNDHENNPNLHVNSHKLSDETKHPIVNLMESQWKLRQQHDLDFPMEGKPSIRNTSIRRKKEIQNSRTMRITIWDLSRKVNQGVRSFKIEKL